MKIPVDVLIDEEERVEGKEEYGRGRSCSLCLVFDYHQGGGRGLVGKKRQGINHTLDSSDTLITTITKVEIIFGHHFIIIHEYFILLFSDYLSSAYLEGETSYS